MADTKKKPGFLNTDWGAMVPLLGSGLQAMGLYQDNVDFGADVEEKKSAISADYAHGVKGIDRQVQAVARDAGQAMGAGNAANYDMEGATVAMAKEGIDRQYQETQSLANDEKAYQKSVMDRQLASIKRQEDAMPMRNLLAGLGIGLGAIGSVGENNWFGLSDSESDLRGNAFRNRRA